MNTDTHVLNTIIFALYCALHSVVSLIDTKTCFQFSKSYTNVNSSQNEIKTRTDR